MLAEERRLPEAGLFEPAQDAVRVPRNPVLEDPPDPQRNVLVRHVFPPNQLLQDGKSGGRLETSGRVRELAPHLGIRFTPSQYDQCVVQQP